MSLKLMEAPDFSRERLHSLPDEKKVPMDGRIVYSFEFVVYGRMFYADGVAGDKENTKIVRIRCWDGSVWSRSGSGFERLR